MGNNVSGFDEYLNSLPRDRVLFGFPGAGGGIKNGIVHYVDSEEPNGKRMPVTIGEIGGGMRGRTKHIVTLFKSSGVPVDLVDDIDGWLKYHAAFILPICGALFMHEIDNNRLAEDKDGIRMFIRACKECGNVLRKTGFKKRQPFKFNLFYWMPEWMLIKMFRQLFGSRYAEIAITMHAGAAADEMRELADEFKMLIDKASIETPNFDRLTGYIK
jgi:2-dehydropantoate 2-reductase